VTGCSETGDSLCARTFVKKCCCGAIGGAAGSSGSGSNTVDMPSSMRGIPWIIWYKHGCSAEFRTSCTYQIIYTTFGDTQTLDTPIAVAIDIRSPSDMGNLSTRIVMMSNSFPHLVIFICSRTNLWIRSAVLEVR